MVLPVKEGLFLINVGQSPYSSSAFLQPPLVLLPFMVADKIGNQEVFQNVEELDVNSWLNRLIFITLDLSIAYLIFGISKNAVKFNLLQPFYAGKTQPREYTTANSKFDLPTLITSIYLLNPIMIGSCVSMSTVIFNNFAIAGSIYFATQFNIIASTLFLAMGTHLTLYPASLIIGIILIIKSIRIRKGESVGLFSLSFKTIVSFIFWNACLMYASVSFLDQLGGKNLGRVVPTTFYSIFSSVLGSNRTDLLYDILMQCYYYPFSLSDLTPNWGSLWYFFTEVFNDFRTFFLLIFHLHVFTYLVPLTIRFKNDGLFWCVIQTAIISVFKAYPCLGDFYFYMTLLLLFIQIAEHMRYGFFIVAVLVSSMFLGPVCFNTWIYKGTGNANFFYFITLVFLVGNILLIVEFVYARLRSDHEWKQKYVK